MYLEKANDPVFSQRLMGDGFVIEIDDELVVSPVDGTIVSVYPSGHAYGILSDDGIEVLIHIGIDTVDLGSQAFDIKVKMDQKVYIGDPLVVVNLELIKEKNKSLQSMVIFTSGETVTLLNEDNVVDRLEEVIKLK